MEFQHTIDLLKWRIKVLEDMMGDMKPGDRKTIKYQSLSYEELNDRINEYRKAISKLSTK